MDEVGVVEVEEGLGHLVDDVLFVPLLQLRVASVLADEGMQVDVHVLEDQVDVLVVAGPDYFLEPDDVGVPQLPEEHYFSVGALRVGGVGKGVEVLLEGLHLFGFLVGDLPDVSIGPTAYLFGDMVLFKHVRFNFLGHMFIYYNHITDFHRPPLCRYCTPAQLRLIFKY
jgi:hypothetical protein